MVFKMYKLKPLCDLKCFKTSETPTACIKSNTVTDSNERQYAPLQSKIHRRDNRAGQQRTSRRQQHCRILSSNSLRKHHYPESNTGGGYCFNAASGQQGTFCMSSKVRDEPLESVCTFGRTEAKAHTRTHCNYFNT